jgi:hypothetical protein
MPLYNQLKTINLDNPKPGDNNNPPNFFIYANFPSTSCHFKNMIQTPDNNFYGVLNFEYGATSPNISISSKGNFTTLDTYTANAFHIMQVIHKSTQFSQVDYNNDLELIFELTPSTTNMSQNNQPLPNLYLCFFLHYDPNSKYTGDLFLLLTSYLKMDKLVSQTSDFNVNNTGTSSYNISIDSAIQSLFQPFDTQNAALSTYYIDNQNNVVVIVNTPIAINAAALNPLDQTSIAFFMQQSKIDQPPNTSVFTSGTDLTMNSSGAVIYIFLKSALDIPNDQKTAPLAYKPLMKKIKGAESDSKAEPVVKKAQGFTTMEGFREGATMTCTPSAMTGGSNNTKVAYALGDSANQTQLILALFEVVSLIGFAAFIYLYSVKIYVGLYGQLKTEKTVAMVSWILGLVFVGTGIGLLFGGLFPPKGAPTTDGRSNTQNLFMTLAGIFLLTTIALYKGSLGKAYTSGELINNIQPPPDADRLDNIFKNKIPDLDFPYSLLKFLLIKPLMFPYYGFFDK